MMRFIPRVVAVGAIVGLLAGCAKDPAGPTPTYAPSSPSTPDTPSTPSPPTNPPRADHSAVYVLQVGGSARMLTPGDQPAWSPDGRTVAFISTRTGVRELYVIDRDGTGLTQLTHSTDPAGVMFFRWSPDGSRIAVGNESELRVMRSDGSGVVAIAYGDIDRWIDDYGAHWSPDGRTVFARIVTYRWAIVYAFAADGTGSRALGPPFDLESYPAASPDGSRVAFVSDRTNAACRLPAACFALFVVNADGTGVAQLTSGVDEVVLQPVWSPDGSRIAFLRYSEFDGWGDPIGQVLEVVGADGTGQRQLTSLFTAIGGWSPDGRTILAWTNGAKDYSSAPIEPAGIRVIPASGGAPELVIPDVSLGDRSADGQWLVYSAPLP